MIISLCGNSSWLRAQQTQRKHQSGCSPIQPILVGLAGFPFVYDSQGIVFSADAIKSEFKFIVAFKSKPKLLIPVDYHYTNEVGCETNMSIAGLDLTNVGGSLLTLNGNMGEVRLLAIGV